MSREDSVYAIKFYSMQKQIDEKQQEIDRLNNNLDTAINFIDQVLQFHLSRFDKKQIDEDINTLIGILSKRGDKE